MFYDGNHITYFSTLCTFLTCFLFLIICRYVSYFNKLGGSPGELFIYLFRIINLAYDCYERIIVQSNKCFLRTSVHSCVFHYQHPELIRK